MNENKPVLSEEQYQKTAKKLKTTGNIMLIVGGISFLVCSVLVFGDFLSFEARGIVGFLWVFSFAIVGFGMVVKFMGSGREIMAYQAQSAMPIAQEGMEKMAPSAGVAAKEIAKGIKEGINEADAENKSE